MTFIKNVCLLFLHVRHEIFLSSPPLSDFFLPPSLLKKKIQSYQISTPPLFLSLLHARSLSFLRVCKSLLGFLTTYGSDVGMLSNNPNQITSQGTLLSGLPSAQSSLMSCGTLLYRLRCKNQMLKWLLTAALN